MIFEVSQVSKWYGEVIGVNDISLTIDRGVTGLLGPNGAGKTTLLKLLLGILKPSKGKIFLFQEPIWNNDKLMDRIGYCPEHDSFYDWMTCLGFVATLATLNGYSKQAAGERASAALEAVKLGEARNKKLGALSKGMRQRLKLAQAIVHDPDIIVMDEPLSGMDPIGRRQTINKVREWGESGKTVIVSSHILHEVEAMTSNILLMHQGRILASGNVHDIRNLIDKHPHHIHVKCSNPRRVAQTLFRSDDIVSISLNDAENSLMIETVKPDAFYSRFQDLAAEENWDIEEFVSMDDNLEAVFKYLVTT
jgi:ABC-2 type transport system ATP-binding protein